MCDYNPPEYDRIAESDWSITTDARWVTTEDGTLLNLDQVERILIVRYCDGEETWAVTAHGKYQTTLATFQDREAAQLFLKQTATSFGAGR